MAALESMNAVEYVRQLVKVRKKPIHSRNRNLSREDLDAVVSSAVAEVSKLISIFPQFRSNLFEFA